MSPMRPARGPTVSTKGMTWIDRKWDTCCDFGLWPLPWPWSGILKVSFWKSCISAMAGPINMEFIKGMWVDWMLDSLFDLELWLWPWIFKVRFWKKPYHWYGRTDWQGMKGIWADRTSDPLCDFEFLRHPWPWPWILDVKFWRKKTMSQEMEGRLKWNERGASQ